MSATILETQRLIIRPFIMEDLPVIHRILDQTFGDWGPISDEAVLLGVTPLLSWFIIFVIVNLIYIPWFEEPGLEQRFGADYLRYKQNVPRWIPRRTPWSMP